MATQISFIFTPNFGEDSHFESYFSDGLVQPPTRESWDSFFADVRTKPRSVAGHFQAAGVEKNEG